MEVKHGLEDEYRLMSELSEKEPWASEVLAYSERWANLMEAALSAGRSLKDVADPTSDEADSEGITGYMFGCSVNTLARYWVHGKKLRHWHNLKTQIHDEGEKANELGGVLNPAIITIGGD